MPFLYETHMHTCQVSACGVSTGKEHVHFYRDAGYTGIIMTDHFFRGNTAVDRELPWKDRINWFWSGYEDAKAEGDKVGLDVFFGLEQNFAGDEYLVYGLTKEYMMEHPEIKQSREVPREEWIRVAGMHEAIISQDQFDEVQRLLSFDTRTAPEKKEVYL